MKPHKCPVCDGQGLVNKSPWIAGDQEEWVSCSNGPYYCQACSGTGIVWEVESWKEPEKDG